MRPSEETPHVEVLEVPQQGTGTAETRLGVVASRLVRGSGLYALANFGIKAVNFLLLPVYTRFLTPGEYGTVSLAESVAAVASLVAGMGLAAGATRLYYQYADDNKALARYVATVFYSALGFAAGIVLLAMLTLPALLRAFAPRFEVPFFPYIALAVGTACVTLLCEFRLTLYQLEQRPGAYGVLAAVLFVATAGCCLTLVVWLHRGAYGMLLGKFLAAAAGATLALVLLRRWLAAGWRWTYLRETLALSLPVVPHQFMAFGLIAADRFILQAYRPLSEVGIYTLAYTFGMVMALVTLSLSQAWAPLFFDVARGGEAARAVLGRLASGLIIALVAVACLGSLLAPDVTRLVLDARYAAVGPLVPWVIGGYLFHGMFGLFHLSLLQGKRTGLLVLASAFALASNLALNLWWIPIWGMYGAAYATFAAYFLEALLMYFIAQRVYFVPYRLGQMLGSLATFLGALLLTQVAGRTAWRPLIVAGGLAACAGLLAWIGRRDLAQVMARLWRAKAEA